MKTALKELLDALDELADDENFCEVQDTEVREQLHDAVYRTLVEPEPGFVQEEFGMLDPAGDERLKSILAKFFAHPEFAAARQLPTPKARLDAFQDHTVLSSTGNSYDEYFGYNDSFE